MNKYLSFFRMSFTTGLQYRAAAFAGIVTQFAWGFLEILVFQAFYKAEPEAFPMSMSATASYVWMQQAFLALFATWMMDLQHVVFQEHGDQSVQSGASVLPDFDRRRLSPGKLQDGEAGVGMAFWIISGYADFGASGDGCFFHACICVYLFYRFAAGGTDCVHLHGGIFRGRDPSPAVFPGKLGEGSGNFAICLHAECGFADLQRKHVGGGDGKSGDSSGVLACGINFARKLPLPAGGKESDDTGRMRRCS